MMNKQEMAYKNKGRIGKKCEKSDIQLIDLRGFGSVRNFPITDKFSVT